MIYLFLWISFSGLYILFSWCKWYFSIGYGRDLVIEVKIKMNEKGLFTIEGDHKELDRLFLDAIQGANTNTLEDPSILVLRSNKYWDQVKDLYSEARNKNESC